MAKIQISINDNLLERADNYADSNGLTRSGLFSISLINYLNTNEAFVAVRNASLAFKKISETGKVDDSTLLQLEDIQRAISVLFPDSSSKR